MEYICLKCGYSHEGEPPSRCPECGGHKDYFRSSEYLQKRIDEHLVKTVNHPSERTKELFKKSNYRTTNGQKSCANCAHSEILDAGNYRERCFCRPMDYQFSNSEQNKSFVCDQYMEGNEEDGFWNYFSTLLLDAQEKENNKPQKSTEDREWNNEGNRTQGQKQKAEKEGCYVATAVYGSYDCPQVWTLRRYRDNTLKKSACGCAFIKLYYSVSPALVRRFGHIAWLKKATRKVLDCFVKRLKEKGVKDYPYED